MSSQGKPAKMLRTYNVPGGAITIYDVNELEVHQRLWMRIVRKLASIAQLVKTREAQGQRLPALFCFPQILQHRLRSINAAFRRDARESTAITAITSLFIRSKVNQHRRVIESLIHSGEPLGLEATRKQS